MSNYKKILKIALIVVLVAAIVLYGGAYVLLSSISVAGGAEGYPAPDKRINLLAVGVAKGLSDTIMLCSLDTETNQMSIYSVPRDTYYHRKGREGANNKINSSYGSGGVDNVVKSVQDLTGVPIHFYVEVDYQAVQAIVDSIGGLEVEIPQDMDYDDPYDDLHIHFKKGQVVSKGEDIIKLLRYRKNNKGGGYKEGDLGRIKMQQHIVQLGIKKVFGWNVVGNIIKLSSPVRKYVKTNMTPKQMVSYAMKIQKIDKEGIDIQTLPGTTKNINGLSFYVVNEKKMNELLKDIQENE
ncbi:MAG: LCP family protein [Bacillota bacterium]